MVLLLHLRLCTYCGYLNLNVTTSQKQQEVEVASETGCVRLGRDPADGQAPEVES